MRTFANPSGITCAAGQSGVLNGPWTMAAICRRTSDNDFHVLISLMAGTSHRGGLWISNGGGSGGSLQVVGGGFDTTFGIVVPNNTHVFLAATKPTAGDSVTPHGWMYRYDTDTWSDADGVGTINADSMSITSVTLGTHSSDWYFIGDYGIGAVWNGALADAQIRQLPFSLHAWYGSAPVAGWLLDQHATSQNVLDWTGGGANQTALTNTSVSTQSVPVFSYGFAALVPHSVPAAGGTTHTQSLAGSTTPAGALIRQTAKSFAGSATPTGSLVRSAAKTLAGALTSAGTLVRSTSKTLAGSVASSGALAAVRTLLLAVSGAVTPAGGITRRADKPLAGSASPAGAVTKQTAKSFAGSTGPSGALLKLLSRLLGGSVAPSGSVSSELSGSRNLQLDLGAPEVKWNTGPVAAKWRAESPDAKWHTGNPQT